MNRKRKPLEVLLLAIAIGSGLIVAAELVLIAMGSGIWLTLVGSAVLGIGVTYALVELRRARNKLDQTIQPPSSVNE